VPPLGQNAGPGPTLSRSRPETFAPQPQARTPAASPAPTPAHTPGTPAPTPSAAIFREEDLHFVEVELAKHIGPLSRVLVKKAAKNAANLVALGAALVENIPDEEGRRKFRDVIRARAK